MATDIKVPTLGESVTEATVAKWLKQAGDAVAQDEPLVELETDKVTLEVNAPAAGVLEEILAGEGTDVEVGALLGRIDDAAKTAPGKSGRGDTTEQTTARDGPQRAEQTAESKPEAQEPKPAAGAPEADTGATRDITVPTLGESVTEAMVAKWLKQVGDAVAQDEPLVELETDKVTLEVNAPVSGTLTEIVAESGDNVAVGALLGRVDARATAPAPSTTSAPAKAEAAGEAPAAAAAATKVAAKQGPGLDPNAAPRSGPDGKITTQDLSRFLETASGPAAATLSPAVARLVAEHELDPSRIPSSGPRGRLTKEDVLAVVEGRTKLLPKPRVEPPEGAVEEAPEVPSAAAAGRPGAAPREERVRMSKLRQTIARRLKEAQNTAAMLTTFNEADMSAVMALRAKHKEGFEKKHGVKLGFMSFFAKAVVAALKELPAVNARLDGEEIVYHHYYDIGMAVSTPRGLMVPVIRDCDGKTFAEIEKSLSDLATRARDGKLAIEEMQGGTFAITNGGIFGSLLSTPILNMPQSGILGLHKIQERPVAIGGKVEIRPMMYLALSYDHRIIDGREAVTFLVRVKEHIEDPERLLLGI